MLLGDEKYALTSPLRLFSPFKLQVFLNQLAKVEEFRLPKREKVLEMEVVSSFVGDVLGSHSHAKECVNIMGVNYIRQLTSVDGLRPRIDPSRGEAVGGPTPSVSSNGDSSSEELYDTSMISGGIE